MTGSQRSRRMVLENPDSGTTYLGVRSTRHGDEDVGIDDEYRRMHTLSTGPTGEGKTEAMKNAALSDIAKGYGVAALVPKGSLIEDILADMPEHRLEDVIYINPATSQPGLNPLQPAATEGMPDHVLTNQKEIIVSEMIQLFRRRSDSWGARFGRLLTGLLRACVDLNIKQDAGYNLMDVYRCVVNGSDRRDLIDRVKNPVLRNSLSELDDLTDKELDPLRRRLEDFTANDIVKGVVSSSESEVDFRGAMGDGKIVLVEVQKGEIGLNPAELVGGIVLSKLWTAAQTRITVPEERREAFYLFVDEFQNFSTENSVLTTILAEGREYRVGAWLTTQYLQRLDPGLREAVLTNCRNKLVFKPEGKDVNTLASSLNGVDRDQLRNLGEYEAVLQTPASEDRWSAKFLETYPPWPSLRDRATVKQLKDRYAVSSTEVDDSGVGGRTGEGVTAGGEMHDALLSVAEDRLEEIGARRVEVFRQRDGVSKADGRVVLRDGTEAFIEAEHSTLSMPGKVLENLKRAVDAGVECIFIVEQGNQGRLESILENPVNEDGEFYSTGDGLFTDTEQIGCADYRVLEASQEELEEYLESEESRCPKLGEFSKEELIPDCVALTPDGECSILEEPCVLIEQ